MKLARFQMEDSWRRPLIVSETGAITGPHGFWGSASADGGVTFPDGSLRGRLLDDGRVVDAQGTELATIAADGSARVRNLELHFDQEGRLVGADPAQPIRLMPPNCEVKQTAMFIFLMTQLRPRQRR